MMSENAQVEGAVEEKNATHIADGESSDPLEAKRPNTFAFAGFLLGGWLALMIVFVVIAALAMTIVGGLLG
ncbi:MAG: hypothetical protein OXF76_20375 [Caldilineaceae bacterium]|nr:hypothetical protein [Caldilineaceae bacterium]